MADDPQPSTRLRVKVVPGASRDEIVGWLGDALKIKVMAPPEKGKANDAVVKLLTAALGIATDDVIVVSGHASPSKVVAVSGMDDETIKKGFRLAVVSGHHPVVDSALVEQCLEVVRNRIGASGQPYVPNRKRAAVAPESSKKPSGSHQGLIEALASLGLTATVAQVEEALGSLPDGGAGL